jgi:tetratricopeptide (TPR) repeat protein
MPNCFVAMGFGQKTAFYLGKKKPRVLDLDKTYENIIKPAVTAAGLECVRADEIQHSTMIDLPMYQQLLDADVVVADISTSNANAIYELGVRHALRPRTTIVMAEKEFAFPFDISHLSIMRYEHLGSDIGASEAKNVTNLLTDKLKAVLATPQVDSPVFIFLPVLAPQRPDAKLAERAARAGAEAAPPEAPPPGPSLADLRKAFEEAKLNAKTAQDWLTVVQRLQDWRKLEPSDPFVVQQLALATYKSESPDKIAALEAAATVLERLQPKLAGDAETVGLWGAIHKRLWDARHSSADLDEAIRSYERGFQLKNDHYNGINLAFLFNVRAKESSGDEAVADRVFAARTRSRVLEICDVELKAAAQEPTKFKPDEIYWLRASRAEALLGLGRRDEADAELAKAKAANPPPARWMVASTEYQLETLKGLLAQQPKPQ